MLSTPSLPPALVEERPLVSIGLRGVVKFAWREQCLVDGSRSPEAGHPTEIVKDLEKKEHLPEFFCSSGDFRSKLVKVFYI